jgi:hypothetical protein
MDDSKAPGFIPGENKPRVFLHSTRGCLAALFTTRNEGERLARQEGLFRMKSCFTVLGVLLTLGLIPAGCNYSEVAEKVAQAHSSKKDAGDAAPQVDSSSLKETTITSQMEGKITPGKNLIYCSTFQIAWNELKDKIVKEDIRLTNEPPIVTFLNKSLSTKADISEDCYVAMAGFGKDGIVQKINNALREKFREAPPVVQRHIEPDWILAYAYLHKNLRFKVAFDKFENDGYPLFFNSREKKNNVQSFGIDRYCEDEKPEFEMGKQVEVLYYSEPPEKKLVEKDGKLVAEDRREFIVRLKTTSVSDELVLACIEPEETLSATFEAAVSRTEGHTAAPLKTNDILLIPKLNLNILHSYSELLKKYLRNKGFEGYWIAEALQSIRFSLTEKGALLSSDTHISVFCDHRLLVFDKPFLLYLKEKGAKYPYFAMWVGNAELMVRK